MNTFAENPQLWLTAAAVVSLVCIFWPRGRYRKFKKDGMVQEFYCTKAERARMRRDGWKEVH